MRFSSKRYPLVLAFAAALAACDDPATAPEPDAAGSGARASQAAAEAPSDVHITENLRVIPRFRPAIRATGAFRPNTPITLHVSAEALHPAADVELRVVTPDAELARRGGWKRLASDFPGRIPAAHEWRGGLGRGQRVERQLQVSFPAPGYYQVVLALQARSDEPLETDSGRVARVGVRSLWLLVGENGGRATETFDPSLLSPYVDAQPGPFQRRATPRPGGDATSPLQYVEVIDPMEPEPVDPGTVIIDNGGGGYTGSTTTYRRYRAAYYHALTGQLVGVPDMKVSYGGSTYYTGTDGYVSLPCPSSANVTIYHENPQIHMDAFSRAANVCGTTQAAGEARMISINGEFGNVFLHMTRAAKRGASFFGYTARQVHIVMMNGVDNSHYDPDSGAFDNSDRIKLDSDDDSDSHVWDSWGVFIQGHEYGHHYQHRALGGLPGDSNDGCETHYLYSLETMRCAFKEGFATYYSVATLPDEGSEYNYLLRGGPYSHARSNGHTDGSRIEGAVATFLLRTSGAYNKPPVQPAATGRYVGQIVKTCAVTSYLPQHSPEIGAIAYCMENQVDPWVRSNFFQSGHPWSSQSNSAVRPYGWTTSVARARWMHDLYEPQP